MYFSLRTATSIRPEAISKENLLRILKLARDAGWEGARFAKGDNERSILSPYLTACTVTACDGRKLSEALDRLNCDSWVERRPTLTRDLKIVQGVSTSAFHIEVVGARENVTQSSDR